MAITPVSNRIDKAFGKIFPLLYVLLPLKRISVKHLDKKLFHPSGWKMKWSKTTNSTKLLNRWYMVIPWASYVHYIFITKALLGLNMVDAWM